MSVDLLNDDGSASMATVFMMAHHGFRRDLGRFVGALRNIERGDETRIDAVREEWRSFESSLHGHHHAEDTEIFPSLPASLRETIDRLTADHRLIDPVLQRAGPAFAALPRTAAASAVVTELFALLDPHFAIEEAEVAPFLRSASAFPEPATEAELEMFADGFAWAFHGIAPAVLERVNEMLTPSLVARLPAASGRFEERCLRAWGTTAAGATSTPIPAELSPARAASAAR